MRIYVIEIRYYNIFRHLRPEMKLLNYIGITETNSEHEVLNLAYELAKKVKHLNCDAQKVINIYFNYCSQIHSAGWLFHEYRNTAQLFQRTRSTRPDFTNIHKSVA